MVGHSLGGLYIRYCIGLMADSDFFGRFHVTPACFVTIASPHLGVRARLIVSGTQGEHILGSFAKLARTMPKRVTGFFSSLTETFVASPLFGRTGK